jgi:hypothetical protein
MGFANDHDEPSHDMATSLEERISPSPVVVSCPTPIQNEPFVHETELTATFCSDRRPAHALPFQVVYSVVVLPFASCSPVVSMQNESLVQEIELGPELLMGSKEVLDHDKPFHITKVPLPDTEMQNEELAQDTSTSELLKPPSTAGVLHERPLNVVRLSSYLWSLALTYAVAAQKPILGHDRAPE